VHSFGQINGQNVKNTGDFINCAHSKKCHQIYVMPKPLETAQSMSDKLDWPIHAHHAAVMHPAVLCHHLFVVVVSWPPMAIHATHPRNMSDIPDATATCSTSKIWSKMLMGWFDHTHTCLMPPIHARPASQMWLQVGCIFGLSIFFNSLSLDSTTTCFLESQALQPPLRTCN
jgi:hypothetical protein